MTSINNLQVVVFKLCQGSHWTRKALTTSPDRVLSKEKKRYKTKKNQKQKQIKFKKRTFELGYLIGKFSHVRIS